MALVAANYCILVLSCLFTFFCFGLPVVEVFAMYLATCDLRDMRLPRVGDNVAINSSLIGSYMFFEDVRRGLWSGVKHLMC